MKTIFAICGSASKNSSNLKVLERVAELTEKEFNFILFDDLSELPHFSPELSATIPPLKVVEFRNAVENSDAVIICTPEYVFSIPSGLKNAIEWCVSTTVFSGKPVGLITASANGIKGHEELKLIMKTIEAVFTEDTTLLIQGVKGKIDRDGTMLDKQTENALNKFVESLKSLIENKK